MVLLSSWQVIWRWAKWTTNSVLDSVRSRSTFNLFAFAHSSVQREIVNTVKLPKTFTGIGAWNGDSYLTLKCDCLCKSQLARFQSCLKFLPFFISSLRVGRVPKKHNGTNKMFLFFSAEKENALKFFFSFTQILDKKAWVKDYITQKQSVETQTIQTSMSFSFKLIYYTWMSRFRFLCA